MGRNLPSELCLLSKVLLVSTHIHRETITSVKTAVLRQTRSATGDGGWGRKLLNTVLGYVWYSHHGQRVSQGAQLVQMPVDLVSIPMTHMVEKGLLSLSVLDTCTLLCVHARAITCVCTNK